MKLRESSSGCEPRPVKGEPTPPVANLATGAATFPAMRRQASVRAASSWPRTYEVSGCRGGCFRRRRRCQWRERVSHWCIRRGLEARHVGRRRPSNLGGPRLSSTTSRLCGEPVSRLRRTARLRVQVSSALEAQNKHPHRGRSWQGEPEPWSMEAGSRRAAYER